MFMYNAATLTGDLNCVGDDFNDKVWDIPDLPFITMDGPEAILDCDIQTNLYPQWPVLVFSITWCISYKLQHWQHENTVVIGGDGCSAIINVAVSFTNGDAIQVKCAGTAMMSNLLIKPVNSNGIDFLDPRSNNRGVAGHHVKHWCKRNRKQWH